MGVHANGVFKGGGAKGIAYAGALQACEDAGVEFVEVAGASAGAITATLVACRYSAEESAGLLPEALRAIEDLIEAVATPGRSSLLSTDALEHWVAVAIANKIRPGWEGPTPPAVTFEEIRRKTCIALYVVTMDLASRQPIVFSPDLSPDMPVAPAVIASSSIPVAFPPRRVVANGVVRRLVDGGAWANYPAFIFHDEDFRTFHGLPSSDDRRTIGFVLDEVSEEADVDGVDGAEPGDPAPNARPDAKTIQPFDGPRLSSDRGAAVRELGMAGALIASPAARAATIAMPWLFVLVSVVWMRDEARSGFPFIGHAPKGLEDLALVMVIAAMAVAAVIAITISMVGLRLGRDLADTGVMGASAAMGVGPSVPYWVGAERVDADSTRNHVAIRIPVPADLTTLHFRPNVDLINDAIARGHRAATERLAAALGTLPPPTMPITLEEDTTSKRHRLRVTARRTWATATSRPVTGKRSAHGWYVRFAKSVWRRGLQLLLFPLRIADKHAIAWFVVVFILITTATLSAFRALELFSEGAIVRPLIWVAIVGVSVGLTVWLLIVRRARRAQDPHRWLGRLPTPLLWIIGASAIVLGLFVIAALVVDPGYESTVNVLRTDRACGEVTDVQTEGIPEGDALVRIEFPPESATGTGAACDFEEELSVTTEQLDALVIDANERDIGHCNSRPRCLELRATVTELEPGDHHIVRFNAERGLALLRQDLWDLERNMGALLWILLTGTLTLFVTSCFQAARWRRQGRNLRKRLAAHA